MDAIINQLVISMQREMENTDKDSQNIKEELPQEAQHHLPTSIVDNWIRVIKKEMEKIGLMQKPSFYADHKRAGELATRIIKKGGRGGGKEEDEATEIRKLKRSFWMWERSLNRKAQSKPAWFVLPGAAGEGTDLEGGDAEKGVGGRGNLERKERDVDTASSENEKNKEMQEQEGFKGGEVREGGERMQQYNPMKSFWKWERALNSRPTLGNTAWFVLDQENNNDDEEEERRENRKRGTGRALKNSQRWGNSLQQSLTI